MAGRSQGRQHSDRRKNGSGSSGRIYVYGSAARQLDVTRAIQDAPVRRQNHVVRKNQEKAMHMNPGYVFFLAAALAVAGFVLIGYIRLQSEITYSVKHIAQLESQLNDLRLSNDEEYDRIESSVSLDEIKRIAVEELGMTYASEGQIITYSGEGSDYVRQVAELPE